MGAAKRQEGRKLFKKQRSCLAVTLCIPEGMAVGVVFRDAYKWHSAITLMGAMALSISIAIQNFPEGAIISLPLRNEGGSRGKALPMVWLLYCWNLLYFL